LKDVSHFRIVCTEKKEYLEQCSKLDQSSTNIGNFLNFANVLYAENEVKKSVNPDQSWKNIVNFMNYTIANNNTYLPVHQELAFKSNKFPH